MIKWKKKEKSPYEYVTRPLINGDPNKKSIEQIIELIKNRYTVERLSEVQEDQNPKVFYECLVDSFSDLFDRPDEDFQKNLANALINMIIKDYSGCELNVGTQYFLAAVIHSLFFCFRERPDDFRNAFCKFNADYGAIHAFCRYVVINEIEKYCCYDINAVRNWHDEVINSDGEVFETSPINEDRQFEVTCCLWEIDNGIDTNKKVEGIYEFLLIESHDGTTSAYRTHRHDLKKYEGIIVL